MIKRLVLPLCLSLCLLATAVRGQGQDAGEIKPTVPVPVTGEQAQQVKTALLSIRLLDTQKQLELERLKVFVLSLQIILKLGPEWEFDFDEMEFRKKTEEKK